MAPVQEEEACKLISVEGDPHPQKSYRLGMRNRPYDINAYKRVRTPATLANSGKRTVAQTPTTMANKKTKVMEEIAGAPAATPSKSKPAATDSKAAAPGSVTRSASKKSWQRRPRPAHSGVPVPDKLQKLIEKRKLDPNDSIF